MKTRGEKSRSSSLTIPKENIEAMTKTGYLPPPTRSRADSTGSRKVAFTSEEGLDDLTYGQAGPSSRKLVSPRAASLRGADPSIVSRPRPIRPAGSSQGRKQRKAVPPVPPLPPDLVKPTASKQSQSSGRSEGSTGVNEKGPNSANLGVVKENSTFSEDTEKVSGAPIARGLRQVPSLPGNQRASVASKTESEKSITSSRRWSWRYLLTNPPFSFRQSGYERNRLSEASASMRSWRPRDENPQAPVGVAYGGVDEIDYPREYFAYAEEQHIFNGQRDDNRH